MLGRADANGHSDRRSTTRIALPWRRLRSDASKSRASRPEPPEQAAVALAAPKGSEGSASARTPALPPLLSPISGTDLRLPLYVRAVVRNVGHPLGEEAELGPD